MTIKKIAVWCAITALAGCSVQERESVPVWNAHSHNDYENEQPLFDALSHHFKSIEADVYAIGDSLFVAHDRDQIKPGRTLRQLYLEPLKTEIRNNNGSVYGTGEEVILFIDIKDDGLKTYQLLHEVLQDYESDLSVFHGEEKTEGSLLVVVSGNRPFEYMEAQDDRYACYDGRLKDLDSDISPNLMPVVSDNWAKYFEWNGTGEMPAPDRQKLNNVAAKAKSQGYLLRFWSTPNETADVRAAVWNELMEAGVGLIGTDHLEELDQFYVAKNE
ncbi:phosphatidylinositol-specific phospholipase C/glycerophosphodiester phosphodiesterase family protein [Sunxiuqinia sp. sy24]|uniref:phosphatidylinositol-specific phospholipase C/glycerophosphodiester phosphodiesterase family protein n=1 Tax=Sunxiuqinia sp. sy24 TaxID=3461495 RepID=UPI00404521C8